jgi:amidase
MLQAWEIWQTHGTWVLNNKAEFGPGIKERFEMAARLA